MLKNYYNLAKPGMIYGNAMTTLAGYLFASHLHVSPLTLIATLMGIGCVIGSACVFNNYIDRDIDALMERTHKRELVVGSISKHNALSFGVLLGLIGFFVLFVFVNVLTMSMAFIGFFSYVFLYTYAKRKSHWGTQIGSISGAMPIVVGYTAVADRLDAAALVLFICMVLWQMPHFYAIAIRRIDDYRKAHIPVLSIVGGIKATKISIVLYIFAYLVAISSLTAFGYAGYTFEVVMMAVGIIWLVRGIQGLTSHDDAFWAKKLFLFSLVVLMTFCVMLALSPLLP